MDDLDLALLIYLEDELSEEENSRMAEDDLFKSRGTEGAFEILIRLRLLTNEEKFREYFRLTPQLFDYVLNHIRNDLSYKPYNRHTKPISLYLF